MRACLRPPQSTLVHFLPYYSEVHQKERSMSMLAGSHAEASTSWLCEALSALVQPDSKFFPWKWGAKIHYRRATSLDHYGKLLFCSVIV